MDRYAGMAVMVWYETSPNDWSFSVNGSNEGRALLPSAELPPKVDEEPNPVELGLEVLLVAPNPNELVLEALLVLFPNSELLVLFGVDPNALAVGERKEEKVLLLLLLLVLLLLLPNAEEEPKVLELLLAAPKGELLLVPPNPEEAPPNTEPELELGLEPNEKELDELELPNIMQV